MSIRRQHQLRVTESESRRSDERAYELCFSWKVQLDRPSATGHVGSAGRFHVCSDRQYRPMPADTSHARSRSVTARGIKATLSSAKQGHPGGVVRPD